MTSAFDQNILLLHSSDHTSDELNNFLLRLSESHLLNQFIIVNFPDSGFGRDAAIVVSEGQRQEVRLFDFLAGHQRIDRIRTIAICSGELKSSETAALAEMASRLADRIAKLVNPALTKATEVRIFAPGYGSLNRPENFFAGGASNVVLIPEDRPGDLGMARPGEVDSDWFGAHIAVETASLIGMWRGMESNPVDDMDSVQPGVNDVVVRFFRSLVRAVRGPTPPLNEILPRGDKLPVSNGCEVSPDPQWAINAAERIVFPTEFYFVEPVWTDPRPVISGWAALKLVPREMINVFSSLPRTLAAGIIGDLQESAEITARHIYGENSWIRLPGQDEEGQSFNSGIDVELALQEIQYVAEQPNLADTPSEIWVALVKELSSIIDGHPAGRDLRIELGNEKRLVVDRNLLSPEPVDSVVNSLLDLVGEPKITSIEPSEKPVTRQGIESSINQVEEESLNDEVDESIEEIETEESETDLDDEAEDEDSGDANETDDEGFEDNEVDEDVTTSVSEDIEETNLEEVSVDQEEATPATPIARASFLTKLNQKVGFTNLISALSERFIDQANHADRYLEEKIALVLNNTRPRYEDHGSVAKGVKVIGIVASLLLLLAVITLTSLSNIVDFDELTGFARVRLWIALTLVLIYLACLNLAPKQTRSAQTYVVVLTTVFVGAITYTTMYLRPLYQTIRRQVTWVGDLPMYALTAITTVLVLLALLRGRHVVSGVRYVGRKALRVLLGAYLYIGAIVVLSRDGAVSQNFSVSARHKLLIFIAIVAITAIVASLIVVSYIRVTRRNQFDRWLNQLKWNVECAVWAARETRLHSYRVMQWLGTAVALERMIWKPLGNLPEEEEVPLELVGNSGLSKFQVSDMSLGEAGHDFFVQRIRNTFTSPGWLYGQYEKAVFEFARVYGVENGLNENDQNRSRPETCSYPEAFNSIVENDATSYRWQFTQALFDGSLDSALQVSTAFENIGDTYQLIFDTPNYYKLGGIASAGESVTSFLHGLEPVGPQALPAGISTLAPMQLAGSAGAMQSRTWWPASVSRQLKNEVEPITSFSDMENALLVAVRVDYSEGVLLGTITGMKPEVRQESNWSDDIGL
jgi:hypothetical protein